MNYPTYKEVRIGGILFHDEKLGAARSGFRPRELDFIPGPFPSLIPRKGSGKKENGFE
jgi:hypothetical protein